MPQNKKISGWFLIIGIVSIIILGFLLFGNIMDNIRNERTTNPAVSFILLIFGVGGIIGYVMIKKRD